MPRQIEKLHFGKSTTGVTISETELQKIEKINELIEVVNEQSEEIKTIKETLLEFSEMLDRKFQEV